MRTRKALVASIFLFFVSVAAAATEQSIEVTIAAFNDFHGHLEPLEPGGRGGAEALAAAIEELRQRNPHTVVVSAGDLVGASPLLSGLFRHEPTIEAMNRLGLDFNAVGNHDLDDGPDELLRLSRGGCHPSGEHTCLGEQVGTPVPFEGARFAFLAANTIRRATGETLFPPYAIREFDGVPVAFLGLTLRGTYRIVRPQSVVGLRFEDEAQTVNRLVERLRAQGVRAIVVLLHEGGRQNGDFDGCVGISGPIVDIVRRLDDEVDLLVTGHTHQAYNCRLPNAAGREVPVTSAGSYGRFLSVIDLRLDRQSGDVIEAAARNVPVQGGTHEEIGRLIDAYRTLAMPLAKRVVGHIERDYTREPDAAGQSALGQLVADAQLELTRNAGADVAFTNPGGLRADLRKGAVTYEDVFAVQPFVNTLITMTLTGSQIKAVLEQQFGCPHDHSRPRLLQVSQGFEYAWRPDAPPCQRVDAQSIRLNGEPLREDGSYRVTVNAYLADGGDGFTVFKEGLGRQGGVTDSDALASYLQHHSPSQRPATVRVRLAQ
ncbi:MAG: bifunctional metallophosphatase/5'-nucleotidase [Pseudomonadota bacterium]